MIVKIIFLAGCDREGECSPMLQFLDPSSVAGLGMVRENASSLPLPSLSRYATSTSSSILGSATVVALGLLA